MKTQFDTPILFIIFNRPEVTAKVFERIRSIRPKYLFVAADGPRTGKDGEKQECERTRAVTEKIDWNCNVKRLYRNNNLGCKVGVSSAIDWFFENVEEGIILEDDCLPDKSFFPFVKLLLKKYKNNEKIMQISGTNPLSKWSRGDKSYFFSNYGSIWGWATWRRAWKKFDLDMKDWGKKSARNRIKRIIGIFQYYFRARLYNLSYKNKVDAWSYAWSFARLNSSGFSVVPKVNLVRNLGFGNNAVHTKSLINPFSNIGVGKLEFPLKYNNIVKVDVDFDKEYFIRMTLYTKFYSLINIPLILFKKFF